MIGWDSLSVETVAAGLGWGEGPVHLASAGGIVFSDIRGDRLLIWRDGTLAVFRQPSHRANGNAVDAEGRLISCEHRTRRVSRTERDGSVTVLADRFGGCRLNSPNDVVVAPDGSIWFTDPPYGLLQGDAPSGDTQEIGFAGVYRCDPATLGVDLMIGNLDKPNGLAFADGGDTLLVSDTGFSERAGGNHHIFRFDIVDGCPRNLSVFATIECGACDGLRVDAAGNVWSTAGDGILCFSPNGDLLGRIELDEMTTNLCFLLGPGPRGLFVTTPTRALSLTWTVPALPEGFCRTAERPVS